VDEQSVRDALAQAKSGITGAPLVLPEEIGEVAFEDGWLAVAINRDLVSTPQLEDLRLALVAAFPGREVELRNGLRVYKGGLGFGEGKHVVAVLGGKAA